MELLDIELQKIEKNIVNKPFTAILKSISSLISQILDLGVPYSGISERLGYTINYIKMLHNFINYKTIQNVSIKSQLLLLEKFQNLHEEIKESKSLIQ